MKSRIVTYIAIGLLLGSCSTDLASESLTEKSDMKPEGPDNSSGENIQFNESANPSLAVSDHIMDGIHYSVHHVSALDYLKRKGTAVDPGDVKGLRRESVFMLEMSLEKLHADIFESSEMQMNQDDAVQYLIGDVIKDFSVHQEGMIYTPNGVNYEGKVGANGKFRVTFFMKDVDLNKDFTVKYYDRLFGHGLIRFTNTHSNTLS